MSNRITIGYARVSKFTQAEEFDALEQQMARLKSAGAQELLVDIESGRSDNRKEFNRLLSMIKDGKIGKLVVTRLDRLGRSVISLHRTTALLEEHKVQLWVLDAPIDLNSPFGWFSLSQMSGLAEFESRLLSNRIRHGMDYSRQQGKANSNVPFGYIRIDDRLTPNKESCVGQITVWDVAKQSIEIYRELGNLRRSIAEIWERYQVKWSVPGLRDWLINPALRGHTVYHRWHKHSDPSQWDVRHNTHEALVSQQEWEEIDYLLKRGRQTWGRNANKKTHHYPLAGQIVCEVCGNNCYRYIARNGKERMRCRKRDEGIHLCSNKQSVLLTDVEQAVIAALIAESKRIAELASTPVGPAEQPELKELKAKLAGLESLGHDPAFEEAKQSLRLRIEAMNYEIQHGATRNSENRELLMMSARQPDFWHKLEPDRKKRFYQALIDRVVMKDGAVQDVKLKSF